LSAEGPANPAGAASEPPGRPDVSGSLWGSLAREGLNLLATGLSEGKQRWVERTARRWAWERRRLGIQLLCGALGLMLIWTALMLGLASVFLIVDPAWWPTVLTISSVICALIALAFLWRARGDPCGNNPSRSGSP